MVLVKLEDRPVTNQFVQTPFVDGHCNLFGVPKQSVLYSSYNDPCYAVMRGFGAVIRVAYSHHKVLQFRPDDIWFTLTKSLSMYINDNAEKYRKLFVSHDGSLEIVAEIDLYDFESGVKQLSNTIRNDNNKLLEGSFSTTTPSDVICSNILLMDSMKKYYSYGMSTLCGIPAVDMLGTRDDWVKLINQFENVCSLFKLEFNGHDKGENEFIQWNTRVNLILNNLLKTFDNDISNITNIRDWWSKIMSIIPAHSGQPECFDGWFKDLYFCTEDKEYITPDCSIEWGQFPKGMVSVPFFYIYPDGSRQNLQLMSGCMAFTEKDNTVTPITSWLVEKIF